MTGALHATLQKRMDYRLFTVHTLTFPIGSMGWSYHLHNYEAILLVFTLGALLAVFNS